MPIVFITIEGKSKREFANLLHEKTNNGISLIIVQKRPKPSFFERIKKLFSEKGGFISLYYSMLLNINKNICSALDIFRLHTKKTDKKDWPAETIFVSSVNNKEVYEKLQSISPSLLVVWGCGILKPDIIHSAKSAINLHMGYAPYYRGVVGNQFALFNHDLEKLGATIHHINGSADAGDIIENVKANTSLPLKEMFRDLNDKAEERFLDIAVRLSKGEELTKIKQDITLGKNYFLKDWTPKIRYILGKRILNSIK